MTRSLRFPATTRLSTAIITLMICHVTFSRRSHFFQVYKELEHKTTAVDEVEDVYAAKEIIAADIDHYIEKFCKA